MEDRLTQQLHLQSRSLERLNVAVLNNTERLRSLEATLDPSGRSNSNATTNVVDGTAPPPSPPSASTPSRGSYTLTPNAPVGMPVGMPVGGSPAPSTIGALDDVSAVVSAAVSAGISAGIAAAMSPPQAHADSELAPGLAARAEAIQVSARAQALAESARPAQPASTPTTMHSGAKAKRRVVYHATSASVPSLGPSATSGAAPPARSPTRAAIKVSAWETSNPDHGRSDAMLKTILRETGMAGESRAAAIERAARES